VTKRPAVRVVAVVVGLFLVSMLAVSLVVKRAGLESLIVEQAKIAVGADVTLEAVSVNWWGGLGLVLHEVSVQGSGEKLTHRPGLAAELGDSGLGDSGLGDYSGTFSKVVLKIGLVDLFQGVYAPCTAHFEGATLMAAVSGDHLTMSNFEIDLTNLAYESKTPALSDLSSFDFELNCSEYAGQNTKWADVGLSGSWQEKQLRVPQLSAYLEDGQITADLLLDWQNEGPGNISGTLRLFDVPSVPLLSPHWPRLGQRLRCALRGEVVGSMSLGDPAERRKSLDLTFSLSAEAGVLDAKIWLQEATPYLGDRQDLKVVAFEHLKHEAQIIGGRYGVNTLLITGSDTDWNIAGWLEFEGNLMLAAKVRLPAGFTPELGSMAFLAEMMRDQDGRVNLAANVTGPTAAPIVTPDIKQMLRGH
jgi:hypothetical protein